MKVRGRAVTQRLHARNLYWPRHPGHSYSKYHIQKSHKIQKKQIHGLYVRKKQDCPSEYLKGIMIDLQKIQYHLTNTWPSYEDFKKESNLIIANLIRKIYQNGVFAEINRLLISEEYPNCGKIGHIVLIAICCAIDSLSAYANGGGGVENKFTNFITKYFPNNYSGKEQKIYEAFRCDSVHGWNLHKSSISSDVDDPDHLLETNGIIHISLYDLFNDLSKAFQKYYESIKRDNNIKDNLLKRYKEIKTK